MPRTMIGVWALLAMAAMVPALAQQGGPPGASDAPKAGLFLPAPDAPVAPLIVPPNAPALAACRTYGHRATEVES